MLFLIEYDRKQAQLVSFRTFLDADRRTAEEARLELELKLHRQSIEREIILLEAPTEEALRRTHQRYFADPTAPTSP